MNRIHLVRNRIEWRDLGYEPSGNVPKGLRASEGAPCPCSCLQFTTDDSVTGRKGHDVHILWAVAIMGQQEGDSTNCQ